MSGKRERVVLEDDDPQEIPYTIRGKDYVLVEADGGAYRAYENARLGGMRWDGEGNVSRNEAAAECEFVLVQRCLFLVEQGRRSPVTREFVEGLKANWIKRLYKDAREISHLDRREREETEAALSSANGSSSATTPSSKKDVPAPKGSPSATGAGSG
jgi:hypothetical protein